MINYFTILQVVLKIDIFCLTPCMIDSIKVDHIIWLGSLWSTILFVQICIPEKLYQLDEKIVINCKKCISLIMNYMNY